MTQNTLFVVIFVLLLFLIGLLLEAFRFDKKADVSCIVGAWVFTLAFLDGAKDVSNNILISVFAYAFFLGLFANCLGIRVWKELAQRKASID